MSDPSATLVAQLPFAKHVGVTVGEGGALALARAEPLLNHVGTMHAGAIFTLGESASGVAVLRGLAPTLGGAMPVAKSATIAYRKPATGDLRAAGALVEPAEVIAARAQKDGKASFDVQVTITGGDGAEVATMTVTWYVRLRQAT